MDLVFSNISGFFKTFIKEDSLGETNYHMGILIEAAVSIERLPKKENACGPVRLKINNKSEAVEALENLFQLTYINLKSMYGKFSGVEISEQKIDFGQQEFELSLEQYFKYAGEMTKFFSKMEEEFTEHMKQFVDKFSEKQGRVRNKLRRKMHKMLIHRKNLRKELYEEQQQRNYYQDLKKEYEKHGHSFPNREQTNYINVIRKILTLKGQLEKIRDKLEKQSEAYLTKLWHRKLSKMQGMNTREALDIFKNIANPGDKNEVLLKGPNGEIINDPYKISEKMSEYYQSVGCPIEKVHQHLIPSEFGDDFQINILRENNSKFDLQFQERIVNSIYENKADYMGPCKLPTEFKNSKSLQKKWKEYNLESYNNHFQLYELINLVDSFKNQKAAGIDKVTYEVLKLHSKSFARFRLLFYNLSWAIGKFPDKARLAMLKFLFKGDVDKRFLEPGYRPISLLIVMGKEIASLVAERIKTYLKQNPLTKNQYGFVSGRTPNMALGRKLDYILSNWDAKSGNPKTGKHIGQRICGSISLDIAKAYDRVVRCFLLFKLWKRGMRGRILVWLSDYFQARSHFTRIRGADGKIVINFAGLAKLYTFRLNEDSDFL